MSVEKSSVLSHHAFSAEGSGLPLHESRNVREYFSLYESFYDKAQPHCMEHEGTVGDIVFDLKRVAVHGESVENNALLALHPPRIIRAAIDYKIQHPHEPISYRFLDTAIKLGLSVYRRSADYQQEVHHFLSWLQEEGLVALTTHQPFDIATWCAMDPRLSEQTANHLSRQRVTKDVLFIALAHGGVAAGMDVYLRYCNITNSRNSVFYPVRFSRYKCGDVEPKLTRQEVMWLQTQSCAREVIVFDEDASSGSTTRIAQDYFTRTVFPSHFIGARLRTATNLDVRGALKSAGLWDKTIPVTKSNNIDHSFSRHNKIIDTYSNYITSKEQNIKTTIFEKKYNKSEIYSTPREKKE